MTGKELLEAMSYVDEEYVARADRPVSSRHVRWQSFAAMAAGLCLILFAASRVLPVQKSAGRSQITMAAGTGRTEEIPLDEGADQISGSWIAENEPNPAFSGSIAAPESAQDFRMACQDAQAMDGALWITVRVEARTEQGLLCTVIDPGTGSYPADAQVTVALPEESTRSALSQKEEPALLQVIYRHADGDWIYAEDLAIVEDPAAD